MELVVHRFHNLAMVVHRLLQVSYSVRGLKVTPGVESVMCVSSC